MDKMELMNLAILVRGNAYAPYSSFAVGAALLGADGQVYLGCNVENSSYSATNCAERSALFSAVSQGAQRFSAIAIAGGKAGEKLEACFPCGVCRQVLYEFCDPESFEIHVNDGDGNIETHLLKDLLPHGFKL